jgi:diguanylate cyclase (GGDEF)-like protein
MSPFIVLPALSAGLLFLERTLRIRQMSPWIARAMLAVAWLALGCAGLFALGVLDYRQTQMIGTVLGPSPIVLGLPAAWMRARRHDRAAMYIVLGWGLYAIGILTMAALLRGLVGANVWTQHAFQTGAMLEMVMWMRVLGVRMDETRREAERADRERVALHSLAHTDALTGMPNRRGLQLELRAALARVQSQQMLAVYMLDLDGFKAVNDKWGHDVGDELLKTVADRLRLALRTRDVVARLGGDEFVVLAGDLPGDEDARRLGLKLIAALQEPIELRGKPCIVGVTIGYALAPLDATEGAELLKLADTAMYGGKQAGKGVLRRTRQV